MHPEFEHFVNRREQRLLLYSHTPPHGRCLLLAHGIRRVAAQADGLRIAEKLLDFQHPPDHPACLEVTHPAELDALRRICTECGIIMEVHEG